MSAASNYLENALFNAVFRNTTYTSPATVYLALFTDDPGEDADGTEVSGGSYERMEITFAAPTNGSGYNSAPITFPTATGSWGTITHFGIYDADTAGNLLTYGELSSPLIVSSGNLVVVPIGALVQAVA